jgi:amidophosphoribosyltransferase
MGVQIDHPGTLTVASRSDRAKPPDGNMGPMREACGVFGVFAPGRQVAPLVYDGLFSLQHRGQESAGMAVTDGETVTVVKDMGLVASVFSPRALASLQGFIGLGHVRYSTMGKSDWRNAQPVFRSIGTAGFAIGHNGNLTNVRELEEEAGMIPGLAPSDSDLIGELIAKEFPSDDLSDELRDVEDALMRVLTRLEGAFSIGCLDASRLYAARDPNGFRPLCLGRLVDDSGATTGWVVSSESPGLATVGAVFEREIEPGELVVIDENGVRSLRPFDAHTIDPRLCVFEFVYFARPDAVLEGKEVHSARRRMGEQLAVEAPVDVDLVIGVPDSGVPAAEGFARRSGVPFGHGLVKNRYIGRTFITPTAAAREDAVRRKLNPLRESVRGERLVVIDDSIVRGTTTRQIVTMLRSAGAKEVHLRISSPPFRWPCFYGIDTPRREELLAANLDSRDIARHLGADSVAYLSLEGMFSAIGVTGDRLCSACLTGEYPTVVPLAIEHRVAASAR